MEANIKKLVELQNKKGYTDTQMGAFLGIHVATYIRWKKERTSPKSQSYKEGIKKLLEIG